MNPILSYQNGNVKTSIYADGTRVHYTDDDEFKFAFAENIDIKITNQCDVACPFCHEDSTISGKHGNIMKQDFWHTLHIGQEVALGGGNVLSHPQFIDLLKLLKEKGVIANITVHQTHYKQNYDLLKQLHNQKLIYGIGVSVTNVNTLPERFCNDIVYHFINGIVTTEQLDKLDKSSKILLLGYKTLRRGEEFAKASESIIKNQEQLKSKLLNYMGSFEILSFDCLALEQLDVKHLVVSKYGQKVWDAHYGGADGSSTFYIDAVEEKFAKSSTEPMEKRFKLMNNVNTMFQTIQTNF